MRNIAISSRYLCFISILCCLFWISNSFVASAGQLQTILLSDQLPPEMGSGPGTYTFEEPILDSHGSVTYFVTFESGATEIESLWKYSDGVTNLIARTGDAANVPGADLTFRKLTIPEVSPSGVMAFYGNATTVRTPDDRNYGGPGLWEVAADGTLGSVAVRNTPSPESGWNFQTVGDSYYQRDYRIPRHNDLRINDSGEAFFSSVIINPPIYDERVDTLWSTGDGLHRAYTYEAGTHIAGLDPGVQFNELYNSAVDENGRSLLFAQLEGPGIDASNSMSLLAEQNGQLSLLWQFGNPTPGITRPFQIVGPEYANMNNVGQIQTYAYINESDHGLVLLNPGGESHIITANGDPAPGTPWDDAVFGTLDSTGESFINIYALNRAGDSAFMEVAESPSTGEEAYGLWVEGNDEYRMVAMGGMPTPGIPGSFFSPSPGSSTQASEGDIYASHRAPWFVDTIALSDAGRLAFLAFYDNQGTLPHSAAGKGIWAEDEGKNLKLIVRTGDFITVAPGDEREIQELYLLGQNFSSQPERNSSFNSLGQIAFRATFADGTSGIFLSNAVAVPEPTTALLIAVGMLLSATRCCRHAPVGWKDVV